MSERLKEWLKQQDEYGFNKNECFWRDTFTSADVAEYLEMRAAIFEKCGQKDGAYALRDTAKHIQQQVKVVRWQKAQEHADALGNEAFGSGEAPAANQRVD